MEGDEKRELTKEEFKTLVAKGGISRRYFLKLTGAAAAAVGLGGVLAACGGTTTSTAATSGVTNASSTASSSTNASTVVATGA